MFGPGSPADVPKLIGILDCDNSTQAIYQIGGLLEKLTAVRMSRFHDGNWWRNWWDKNRETFPEKVRLIDVPSLPKTKNGKSHKPFPLSLETIDSRIVFANSLDPDDAKTFELILNSMLPSDFPAQADVAIPKLIGLIDADNSQTTFSTLGVRALYRLTNVEKQVFHDGSWWIRWWEKNKTNFSNEAQLTTIPKIKKTAYGKKYWPYPASLDSTDGLIDWVKQGCPGDHIVSRLTIGKALISTNDPKSIPVIIGWATAANSPKTIQYSGDAFETITGIKHSSDHSLQWWSRWWNKNMDRFELSKDDALIPDMTSAVAKFEANNTARKNSQLREQGNEI